MIKAPKWRTLRPDMFGTVDDFYHASYPAGLATITDLPNFTQGLLDRGRTPDDVAGIMGHNWLRFFRNANS